MASKVVEAMPPTEGLVPPADNEKTEASSTTPTLHDTTDQVPFDEKTGEQVSQEQKVDDSSKHYVTGFKLVSMMISITMAAFLMLLDMSIIVTAIPRITSEFHSLGDIGWYGSAYNLASAALQPLSGKLYTYFTSKWLFLGFLFIFEVGSLICGVAQSSTMFIIGRAIAGIGSSGIQNGAFTMIAAAVPLEKRPSLMGVLMGCAQLGLVIGPLVGGALTEYTTWRWCFYINLPIGGLGALLILLVHIPDTRIRLDMSPLKIITSRIDLAGLALFAPAVIMLLMGLEWGGNDYPWKSATVIGLFCGGGVLAVIFLFWENRIGDGAMIPLPILRKRQVWTACLTMLFLFMTVFVASYYLPIYFQSVKGASPFTSGVNMLPGILTQLCFGVLSGFLTQKVGYYLPFAVFSGMISAVGNGLLSTLGPHTSTARWAGYQMLVGFGRGTGMQMPILAIQANTTPATTPTATAILVFSQTFGGAVFITVANVIFNNKLKAELKSRVPHLNADLIINAGATSARKVTPPEDLPQVLASYAKGVDSAFYLAIAGACAMFITAWGIGWKDIRKKKPVQESKA